jgi:phosphoribosylglycinamide formyltransferase-1
MANKKIVILISGRGSNFVAIAQAAQRENWAQEGIEIACVVSNRPEAAGLERARELGYETAVVDHKAYPDRVAFEKALIEVIDRYDPAVVVLAGFMRILTDCFVNHYDGRILNIHPALLPLFKGLDTHQRAIDAGVRIHGCTVHFVSAELDGGAIIGQAAVPVVPGDDADTLAHRALKLEHVLYPRAVKAVAAGDVVLKDNRVEMPAHVVQQLALFSNEI